MRSHPGPVLSREVSDLRDAALIDRLDGPEAGLVLNELHRRHAGSALRLAHRRLGDRQRAEEVVQEVFLDLWLRPERYNSDRGSIGAFLAVQTKSRALDVIRSDRSRALREGRQALLSEPLSGTPGASDAEDAAAETAERVQQALQALPERERIPIRMALYNNQTYRQVAESLGLPEGTVKGRIRSGLSRLRTELAAAPAPV